MRITGYCEKCRRVKTVNVRVPRPGGVQVGVCAGCEREQDDRMADEATTRRTPLVRQLYMLLLNGPGPEKLLVEYRAKSTATTIAHELRHAKGRPNMPEGRFEIRSGRIPGQDRWGVWARYLGPLDQSTELNEGTAE